MAFITMPRIIATETLVIETMVFPVPKEKTSPPMPATKIVEATNIFLVLLISIFSLISIFTPLEAMKP